MGGWIGRAFLAAAIFAAAGCATAVDMDAVNSRLDDQERRIAALEAYRAGSEADKGLKTRLEDLEKELETLRKEFADSKWTVGDLSEKVESLKAFMEEVQQFMARYSRKGGEIDRALEQMADRLEADVKSLADKLKRLLEEEQAP